MMNGGTTPTGGRDGRQMSLGMGMTGRGGALPTPAASPHPHPHPPDGSNNVHSPNDDDNNNNNNNIHTTPSFVHTCTTHLQRLTSAISALQGTLSLNSAARQTCQQAHFEAVELLKAILRAEEAGTLGRVLVTRGVDWEGVGLRQQAVLGMRVVWAVQRWREVERGVREGGGDVREGAWMG